MSFDPGFPSWSDMKGMGLAEGAFRGSLYIIWYSKNVDRSIHSTVRVEDLARKLTRKVRGVGVGLPALSRARFSIVTAGIFWYVIFIDLPLKDPLERVSPAGCVLRAVVLIWWECKL